MENFPEHRGILQYIFNIVQRGNVKTLGMHHGYDFQDDNIWKSIIKKMKSCIHVRKSRNLTFGGKTLIIKNALLSLYVNTKLK